MATATIEVKYVNPPKNGNPRASWSIKDAMGSYWGFYPDKVGTPQPGQHITVEWSSREYQGKTYKTIEKVIGESGDTGPTSPRPASNGGGSVDAQTAKRIFVCGVLNAAIAAGKVDPFNGGELTDVCIAAGEAYANTFKSN